MSGFFLRYHSFKAHTILSKSKKYMLFRKKCGSFLENPPSMTHFICVYKRIVKMNMIIGNCKKKKKRSSRYFSSYLFCSFLSPSNELMIQNRLKTNSNIPQQNSKSVSLIKKCYSIMSILIGSIFFFLVNMGVRVSLRAPRQIPRALKLTTM